MQKTWNKAFHKRRVWNTVSKPGRMVYYMQPLVEHLFDTWIQPLPFPTLLKFFYSCVVLFFILLPILYPMVVLLLYYGIFQYAGEQHFGLVVPENCDLLGAATQLWRFEVTNKKYMLRLYAHGSVLRLQLSQDRQVPDQYLPLPVEEWF
ncbi:uncharacterized protein LOC108113292 isoform X2 [Drosophila eugracilis]|uniref:uncharacterized protein LOC108113292 isoform X2 n=1 Tax=Drosophila eugracilis TaxID=29029 RepID=UPI0007E68EB6|nr:uncharacterized protein LOC108113292 isoform X2 [Drosophila eugracilis]